MAACQWPFGKNMKFYHKLAISSQSAFQFMKNRPLNSQLIDAHGEREKFEYHRTQDKGNYQIWSHNIY
jgi:hypothetical protein